MAFTAIPSEGQNPVKHDRLWKAILAKLESIPLPTCLTAVCGLSLILGFIPRFHAAFYIAVVSGSYEALKSSYEAVQERKLDVNILMVLAAIGAIAVHRVSDAAALLFLFSLSTTLESVAMARTKSAIQSLIKLRPSRAWKVNGSEAMHVPVEELELDDIIRINAFDSVPTDAIIVEGQSTVDQSSMTGESIPVACAPGDHIIGGTQNQEGTLLARVTAKVGDSALDRIVALVQDAQDNKASGERISEWFGQTYTIFVLVAFGASYGIRSLLGQPSSEAFYLSLTLLVGLSPCALVISTPATTLSALAWCARNGILVRGGEFVELAGRIKGIALDKTGTLTVGKPVLTHILFAKDSSTAIQDWETSNLPPSDPALLSGLMKLAAIERSSSHPIASAIVSLSDQFGLEVIQVTGHRVVPGLGVEAIFEDQPIMVGRRALLESRNVLLPTDLIDAIHTLEQQGYTTCLASTYEGCFAFAFSDQVRKESPKFIRSLRDAGVNKIIMLTGDRLGPANLIAKQIGIDNVHAHLLPHEKTEIVQQLTLEDPTIMVGDGVNDAPSLAASTVGIAMGGFGSDVAMNAADVVLMNDRLENIPKLILLGRRTVRTIRFNLLFAGGMITVLALSSLFLRVPLPLAVLGHEGSTVIVILNGLRMLSGPGSIAKGHNP